MLLRMWLEKRIEENAITTYHNHTKSSKLGLHLNAQEDLVKLSQLVQWISVIQFFNASHLKSSLLHLHLHNSALIAWSGYQDIHSMCSNHPEIHGLPSSKARCWAVATNVSAAWHRTGRPPGAPRGSTTRGLQKADYWPSSVGCAAPEASMASMASMADGCGLT